MLTQYTGDFETIASVENLIEAWREFVRGKRGKQDVQEFSVRLFDNILSLHGDLARGAYRHGDYRAFRICDPKPRHIHKASVRDRLVHHAIYRILYPFFDRTFIADSFSCRVGKGTHRAMNRFRAFAYRASGNHTRTAWVLKCDIKKFFAHIDHAILVEMVRAYIPDARILWLLKRVIHSFSSVREDIGLPLGNLTSQLFCNIYMNEFDQYVKHQLKVKYYIRYADDFVILSENNQWLHDILPRIAEFLKKQLHLALHPKKVSIETVASGVDFLGWIHFPDHQVLRTATKRRMLKRLIMHPTQETLNSYKGLLLHGNAAQLRKRILGDTLHT